MSGVKKTPFLDFYMKHVESLRIPTGLCLAFDDEESKLVFLFRPEDHLCAGFWAHYLEFGDEVVLSQNVDSKWADRLAHEFNPLRQTIVLFCAAINNEL